MISEAMVEVSDGVELFVAHTDGPTDRTLLVVHGGPDWDHTYLREPLARLDPNHRVVWVDLRGCGRSTRGLAANAYTPDAAVGDLLALINHLGARRVTVLGFLDETPE